MCFLWAVCESLQTRGASDAAREIVENRRGRRTAGGARYNISDIRGVGIGTVTDSLAALKYQVYDQKNISITDLTHALKHDFIEQEGLLNLLRNHGSKYGNDDDRADDLMKLVFECDQNAVTGRRNMRGGRGSCSGHFRNLSRALRDEIIGRTEQGF